MYMCCITKIGYYSKTTCTHVVPHNITCSYSYSNSVVLV